MAFCDAAAPDVVLGLLVRGDKADLEQPVTVAAPCKHHWDIEEAHGPVALGICRNCGMTKWFDTSYSYQYGRNWHYD